MPSVSRVATDSNIFSAAVARSAGFIALPLPALRRHGQSAQILGTLLGVLRMDGRETFRRQADLARLAGMSLRSFRQHLKPLVAAGIVVCQPGDTTNGLRLGMPEAKLLDNGYLPLPRFALGLPWSQRVIYAYLIFRSELGPCSDSLGTIGRTAGLPERTVRRALAGLQQIGWIDRGEESPGDTRTISLLKPPADGADNLADHPSVRADNPADHPGQSCRVGADNLAGPIKEEEKEESKKTMDGFRRNLSQKEGMGHITRGALLDTLELLEMFDRATAAGLLPKTTHHRLMFVGAACHALRCGKSPPAMFQWIVANEKWGHITLGDEDQAKDRLRKFAQTKRRPDSKRTPDIQESPVDEPRPGDVASLVKTPPAPETIAEFERRRAEVIRQLAE